MFSMRLAFPLQLRLSAPAIALMLALGFAPGMARGGEPQTTPSWAPQLPWMALGTSYQALITEKGEGKKVYARNADGEFLSNLEYSERWFGMEEPIKTEYIILFGKDTISQLTLYFEPKPERKALIKRISGYLGEAEEGAAEPGAPSEYGATWIADGIRYDLQDYGDYAEMYVSLSYFQSPDVYKLSEAPLAYQRRSGSFWTKKPQYAYLAGLRGEGRAPLIDKIALIVEAKEKDGVLTALPAEMSRGYNPQLSVCDLDGDHQSDALITVSGTETGGQIQAAAFSLAKRNAKLLFNSNAGALPKISGELENGYKGTIKIEGSQEVYHVELASRKKALDDAGVYKDGTLAKPVSLEKTTLTAISANAGDGKATSELKTTQSVFAAEEIGALAVVDASLRLTAGEWKIVSCSVSSAK